MFTSRCRNVLHMLGALAVIAISAGMVVCLAEGEKPKNSPPRDADKEPIRLEGHPRSGISLGRFSPDGKTIACNGAPSGDPSDNKTAPESLTILYEAATGKEIRRLKGPRYRSPIAAVFSPDGKKLAVGYSGSSITLWDWTTGKKLHDFEGSHFDGQPIMAFSPDSKILAGRISGSAESFGKVYLWDVATGKQIRSFGSESGALAVFGFASDGKTLLAERHAFFHPPGFDKGEAKGTHKITAELWSVPDGKHLGQVGEVTEEHFVRDSSLPVGLKLHELGADERFRVRSLAGNKLMVLPHYRKNALLTVSKLRNMIILSETATGKELRRFEEFKDGHVNSVALAPDGNTLVAAGPTKIGGGGSIVLIWDVSDLHEKVRSRAGSLSAKELEALWANLADIDGTKAHGAMHALAATPEQAVRLLKERLRPAEGADRVPQLIEKLDDKDFRTREKASEELESLGETARSALEKALAGKPSSEMRRHIEQLLKKLNRTLVPPQELRGLRAVDVLAQIGTAEARALLEQVARGAPGALLTHSAKESLERLAEKPSPKP